MTSASPHIRAGNSPLDSLIEDALFKFGVFAPSTIDGDLNQLMLAFANEVLDEIEEHPYWDEPPVPHYVSIHDARPVEDTIIVHGLLAKYAIHQRSNSAQIYWPQYQQRMSARLWQKISGGGKIELRPHGKQEGTSPITGTRLPDGDS